MSSGTEGNSACRPAQGPGPFHRFRDTRPVCQGPLWNFASLRFVSSLGLPPSSWTYSADTVIPTLAMVETWQWTPLVMLIVLGGLASLPVDPYEAAKIDGANGWQTFRHISLPLLWPFIVVAMVIRTIDALKSFDVIYVITVGGPGSASTTINIMLYQQAFSYYHLGYASAIVVVFFALILAISYALLAARQQARWQ